MGIPYIDCMERMKEAGRLKNDSAVARSLDITPEALSNYKKRDRMPAARVVRFAVVNGISIDWLVTGQDAEAVPAPTPPAPDLNSFSPAALIYTGKLLSILRSDRYGAQHVTRSVIDMFEAEL